MNEPESFLLKAARWLAFGSSALMILGIAPSQILLAVSLVALLLSEQKLRLPPIKLPLGLFLLGTLVSIAFSTDPAAGIPQIRKFFVFGQLLVVYSLFRDIVFARWLFMAWGVIGGISAARGFVQFGEKLQRAEALGRDFYSYYIADRITGFMSHWYTFSVEEMFVLTMLGSFLFFSPEARRRTWLWVAIAFAVGFSILLAETRGVWIAVAAAALYLIWFWKRWLIVLVPVGIAAGFFVAPRIIRDRFTSILNPSTIDSNQFRVVTARTGLQMIRAHPLLGLGPEMPRIRFNEFVPADIPRPLPDGSYIHLHNIYLHYAAERGIPTLLAFLWLIGRILYDFAQGLRKLPPGRDDRRFLLHGGIAIVIAILVEGFVDVNLGDSEILAMFLAVVACGYLALEKIPANA